jgi:voltage-gated potassium channel
MTRKRWSELTRAARRRLVSFALLRSAITIVLLVAVYYTVPLDRPLDPDSWIWFGLGLVTFAAVIVWQVRAIVHADYPRLRALQAITAGLTLLITFYASTYSVIATDRPDSFSEALNRTDALYFTVTVFSTVGFGDITPLTELARIVAITQMLVGLTALGLIAKVLLGAADVAVRRHEAEPQQAPTQPPSRAAGD